jgi:predicted DNA-binding transcriptional regulator AlpA
MDPTKGKVSLMAIVRKGYVSVQQAAKKLGVGAQSITNWVKDGKFPAALRGPGGRYYLLESEVDIDRLFTPVVQETATNGVPVAAGTKHPAPAKAK